MDTIGGSIRTRVLRAGGFFISPLIGKIASQGKTIRGCMKALCLPVIATRRLECSLQKTLDHYEIPRQIHPDAGARDATH